MTSSGQEPNANVLVYFSIPDLSHCFIPFLLWKSRSALSLTEDSSVMRIVGRQVLMRQGQTAFGGFLLFRGRGVVSGCWGCTPALVSSFVSQTTWSCKVSCSIQRALKIILPDDSLSPVSCLGDGRCLSLNWKKKSSFLRASLIIFLTALCHRVKKETFIWSAMRWII